MASVGIVRTWGAAVLHPYEELPKGTGRDTRVTLMLGEAGVPVGDYGEGGAVEGGSVAED